MQRVWMRCLDGATKKYAERGGMEVVQYEAEQAFWEVYCESASAIGRERGVACEEGERKLADVM